MDRIGKAQNRCETFLPIIHHYRNLFNNLKFHCF